MCVCVGGGGGHLLGTLQQRAITQSVDGGGGDRQSWQGVEGNLHIWFRCDVITLISHQRGLWHNMVGQEVGIYDGFKLE